MRLTNKTKAELLKRHREFETKIINGGLHIINGIVHGFVDEDKQITFMRDELCEEYQLTMDELEKIIYDDATKRAGWKPEYYERINDKIRENKNERKDEDSC